VLRRENFPPFPNHLLYRETQEGETAEAEPGKATTETRVDRGNTESARRSERILTAETKNAEKTRQTEFCPKMISFETLAAENQNVSFFVFSAFFVV